MSSVLAIDDDAESLDHIAHALRQAGYQVETVLNAQAGLKRMATRDFDAVVLEIFLAEQEGIETIIEMMRRWPHQAIVAMSGGRGIVSASYALSLAKAVGASEVLAKPFSGSDLTTALESALTGRDG
jgi:DNA-binding NtrC family response regulator